MNDWPVWARRLAALGHGARAPLYVNLGGSRGGSWRTYRNLMLTMVLGGLWHGAAYNFAAWGVFHGAISMASPSWPRC